MVRLVRTLGVFVLNCRKDNIGVTVIMDSVDVEFLGSREKFEKSGPTGPVNFSIVKWSIISNICEPNFVVRT